MAFRCRAAQDVQEKHDVVVTTCQSDRLQLVWHRVGSFCFASSVQLVGKIWLEIVIAILLSGMPCIWIAGQPAETKAAALATQTYIAARAVAMSLVPSGSTPSSCVGTPRVLVSCCANCAGMKQFQNPQKMHDVSDLVCRGSLMLSIRFSDAGALGFGDWAGVPW